MLNRWLSYTVSIVLEFAWAVSGLVVLDKWLSYRSGRLNRFDFTQISKDVFNQAWSDSTIFSTTSLIIVWWLQLDLNPQPLSL